MCYHDTMSVGRDISRLCRYCPDPASIGALHRTVYAGASQGWGMVGPTLAKNGHNNASSSYNMSLCDLETRTGGALAVCGPLQRRSDPPSILLREALRGGSGEILALYNVLLLVLEATGVESLSFF